MAGPLGRRAVTAVYQRSAQVWAGAALVAALLPPGVRLGWWLPLHLAFAGTVSQAIVGGQLQFSSALAKAAPTSGAAALIRLAMLNAGVLGIVLGRAVGHEGTLVVSAVLFGAGCAWAGVAIERIWRRSITPKFPLTRAAYLFASVSIVAGALLGASLGAGWFSSGGSYASHRLAHMGLNLLGWAGLTVMGTLVTLLPTVLHVRVPEMRDVRLVPAVGFAGVAGIAAGQAAGIRTMAVAGGLAFGVALVLLARYAWAVVAQRRARAIPIPARHLLAGIGWLAIVAILQVPLLAAGEDAAVRDLWVVGAGGGLVFQAVIGAWAFLMPMSRSSAPRDKGRELVAFELGARTQVLAYNAGLALVLLALRGLAPDAAGATGLALIWLAAAWALAKTAIFPWLAQTKRVAVAADRWWAPRAPVLQVPRREQS